MTVVAWKLRLTNGVHRSVAISNIFTETEIQAIKDTAVGLEATPSSVGQKGENKEIRRCQIKWFRPEEGNIWVYQRLVDVVQKINSQYFNFNLYGIQTLQYTIYDASNNEFYAPHRDSFVEANEGMIRKLTFSIQLSDPSEYEGGELITDVGFYPNTASKNFGDVTFFLSDAVHEATPVTKGCRHVLVGWVVGPPMV